MSETRPSICRFCHANCAILVDVEDGVPVAEHLRSVIGAGHRVTMLAVDGHRAQDVLRDQLRRTARRPGGLPLLDEPPAPAAVEDAAETRAAVAAGMQKGIRFRLRALVWVQGESDANI